MVCIWNRQDITKTQKQSGIASSDRGLRFVVIIRLRLHLETNLIVHWHIYFISSSNIDVISFDTLKIDVAV